MKGIVFKITFEKLSTTGRVASFAVFERKASSSMTLSGALENARIERDAIPVRNLYTRPAFWGAFFAHFVIAVANSMTFRFADLVIHLGGTEQSAGFVVSWGIVIALLCRIYLGQALDHYGLRVIWILTGVLFVIGTFGFAVAPNIVPSLYCARILYSVGLAGAITGTNLFIQNITPYQYRAEAIASMGSAGFLGVVLGPSLGDLIRWIFPGDAYYLALFLSTTVVTMIYLVTICCLSWGETHQVTVKSVSFFRLLKDHQPGMETLVALSMGLSYAIAQVFVTRFVNERQLGGLSPFFMAYAISAFIFRWVSREWTRRWGRPAMISIGLTAHLIAMAAFVFVNSSVALLLPATLLGFGFALLFPAVVSLITEAYPDANRGSGTNIALGSIELGTFLAAPIIGSVITWFDGRGYNEAFLVSAFWIASVLLFYLVMWSYRGPRRR